MIKIVGFLMVISSISAVSNRAHATSMSFAVNYILTEYADAVPANATDIEPEDAAAAACASSEIMDGTDDDADEMCLVINEG